MVHKLLLVLLGFEVCVCVFVCVAGWLTEIRYNES